MSQPLVMFLIGLATLIILGLIGLYALAFSKAECRNGRCPACDYPWVYGYGDLPGPMRTTSRRCPNCGTQQRQ